MKKRDRQDTEREFSPLKPADDAIIVDTTDLKYDEVKDKIVDIIDKISKIKEIEGDNFPRQNDFF